MRQITALETIKHHPYYLEAGDVKAVPEDVAAYLIGHGWAEDTETGEKGERIVNGAPIDLEIPKSTHGVQSTEV